MATPDAWSDLEARVLRLVKEPVTQDDMTDVAGTARRIETVLADYRRGLLDEIPHRDVGDDYETVTSWSTSRSYDDHRLVADLTAALIEDGAPDVTVALMRLVDARVVDLKWRWTELRHIALALGVKLRIVDREIETGDPDGAHVGEVKKPYSRVVPKQR